MATEASGGYAELALPLTNSRGLGKFIRFDCDVPDGPDMPLVVSPHVMGLGKPYYTRQALYFLSGVECVIRVMVPSGGEQNSDEWLEDARTRFALAADTCLFEYSLRHPESRLTTRSDRPVPAAFTREHTYLVLEDRRGRKMRYLQVDGDRVGLLAPDEPRRFERTYGVYLDQIHTDEVGAIATRSEYDLWLDSFWTGEDSSPVKFREVPYTFDELALVGRVVPVDPNYIFIDPEKMGPAEAKRVAREFTLGLFNQPDLHALQALPFARQLDLEIMSVSQVYNPVLLDFYFSGLGSLSPISEFRAYYGVIEYLFEDATYENALESLDAQIDVLRTSTNFGELIRAVKAMEVPQSEWKQIREVVRRYVTRERIVAFLREELPEQARAHFESYRERVSGKEIQRLTPNSAEPHLIADRIYSFRNAIFHAKRTHRGIRVSQFRPYTEETKVIEYEALLLRMVAQEIVKQVDVNI